MTGVQGVHGVHGVIVRERLLPRLDTALSHRVTAVVADAGFGKTTLLQQWLDRPLAAHVARPVSRDVAGIAGSLVDALRTAAPESAARLDLLGDAGPDGIPALAGVLCAALAGVPGLQVVLAVDDTQLLTPAAARLLEALARQAPPTLHLLLLGRTAVPFPTDRLGEVQVLTGADLALDDAELSALLTAVVGDDGHAAEVEGLLGRWPAAVRLAAEALSRGLRIAGERDLARLAHEVLRAESPQTRRLAQVVAPFEAFTPEMVARLGLEDAAATLDQLEGRGILLRPADGWLAFPRMMRDFLRAYAPLPPQEHRDVVRRAAGWLEEHGEVEGALRCHLDEPDVGEVARLLRRHGRSLVESGRGSRVAQALALTGADEPQLAAVAGLLHESRGEHDEALVAYGRADRVGWASVRTGVLLYQRGRLEESLAALARPADEDGDEAVRLAWRSTVLWARGQAAEAEADAQRALELAAETGSPQALAGAHVALALVAAHRGDRDANKEHYRVALEHAERAQDLAQVVRVLNNLGSALLEEGRFRESLAQLDKAIDLAEAAGLWFFLSIALGNRGELRFHLGQFDAASEDLEAALRLDEAHAGDQGGAVHVLLGHVYRHRACTALARQAYETALEHGRASGDVTVLAPALAGLAQLLAETDGVTAQALVDEALALDSGLSRVTALLAAGWVAVARGDREGALSLAVEAEQLAARRLDALGRAEALHLAGVADPVPYDPRLREAAELLTELGTPVWLARVRLTQARKDPEGHALVAEVARMAGDVGARLLADQAAVVARTLDAAPPAPGVDVCVLGGFRVRRDGRAVERVDWPDAETRGLLERLTVRPSWTRAHLARSLWPSAPDGERLLEGTVARLQELLGPHGGRVVVTGDAVRLEGVALDVTAFLAEAEEGLARADVALLRRAEARYAGDVLEDSPTAPWAEPLREEVRARYVEVARALVRLSEPEAAARYCRRILERDPYDEGAHLSLIRALDACGRPAEARRCWATYAQRLDELGLEAMPWSSDGAAEGVAAVG